MNYWCGLFLLFLDEENTFWMTAAIVEVNSSLAAIFSRLALLSYVPSLAAIRLETLFPFRMALLSRGILPSHYRPTHVGWLIH